MPRPCALLRIVHCLSLLLLTSLFIPARSPAQGGGRIQGIVRDGETGELLDFANVLIKDSNRGTITIGGGKFYFQGLPPGRYSVLVLYLGYAPTEKEVVVRAGETAELNFALDVVVVDVHAVIDVDAKKYMVEVKDSDSSKKITGEQLDRIVVDTLEEAIARTPGVVMRAGELHIRGGRSNEISRRIDDMPVDDPLGGRSISVSRLAVEDIETVTGGLDPEYGNALSGVVNFTTRIGREYFEGGLRYTTDDFGRQDKTYTNSDRLEFGFGGPTPVRKLTYWVSGDLRFSDTENYSVAHRPEYKVTVGDMTLFKFRRRQVNDVKGSTKWAYKFNSSMMLTGEYTSTYSANQFYAPNWSVSGYAKRVIVLPRLRRAQSTEGYIDDDVFLYEGQNIAVYYGPWFERMMQSAKPAIVVDFRNSSYLRRVAPVLRVRGVDGRIYTCAADPMYDGFRYPYSPYSTVASDSSHTWFNSADRYQELTRMGQQFKLVWKQNLTDDTFYTLKLGLVAFDGKSTVAGKEPWEFNHGGVNSPDLFFGQYPIYLAAVDYYSDPDNPLFVTTSDYPFYQEEYSRSYVTKFDLTTNRWTGHLVKTGVQLVYNDLERMGLSLPARERQSRFTGNWSQGSFRNTFHTFNPEASWYVQDRWEHEGMVVSYGFRWDLFSPGSAADIVIRNDEIDDNVIKFKTQLSPRLGFAFPITERDGFHFHYGRSIQFPSREFLFAGQDPLNQLGILGNPNLKAMTTISYQAGIKHQFTDYLAGTFALYSRDIYDLVAATQFTDEQTGVHLDRYINKAYASARGVEFSLQKRFVDNFEFDISYSFAFADGVASEQEHGSNPEGLQYLPNLEMPLDWDQRHTLNLSLYLAERNAWSGSITFSYGSGYPWTPFDRLSKRQDPLLENSRRHPGTFALNVRGTRHLNLYGQRVTVYFEGINLINQDMVRQEAPPIMPAMLNADYGYVSYLTETGKYGGAYLTDVDGDNADEFVPVDDPRVFEQHRLFRIGIGWQF